MPSERLTSPSRRASFEELWSSLPLGLTQTQVTDAFDRIISGEVPDVQIAAFLFGLRVKGESTDEVQGIAESLLRASGPGPRRGTSQCRSRVRAGRGQVRPLHRTARGEDERMPGRHRRRFGDGKAEVVGDGSLALRNHPTGPDMMS